MAFHKTALLGDIHPIHNWAVADATALAALSVASGDIGKVARQLDTGAYYILKSTGPAVWVALGGGGSSNPSVQTITSASTVTPVNTNDQVEVTALATNLTIANTASPPAAGWGLSIYIKDNGTARTLTWGSDYRGLAVALPTTTVVNKRKYCGFVWNQTDSKWDLLSVGNEL